MHPEKTVRHPIDFTEEIYQTCLLLFAVRLQTPRLDVRLVLFLERSVHLRFHVFLGGLALKLAVLQRLHVLLQRFCIPLAFLVLSCEGVVFYAQF